MFTKANAQLENRKERLAKIEYVSLNFSLDMNLH